MSDTWTAEEQAEHRKQWVAALRGGTFAQTKGMLKNRETGAICCLGVACELSGLGRWMSDSEWRQWGDDPEEERLEYSVDGQITDGSLPNRVREWLGLRDVSGESVSGHASLIVLNDDGRTFPEIADIIEAEPEGLVAK